MRWLDISSWSINFKFLAILVIMFAVLNVVYTPLLVDTFNDINSQAFRQVVTESALRQKAAIDEDFNFARSIFEQFRESTLPTLSIGFITEGPATRQVVIDTIYERLLDVSPALFQQAWMINTEGEVVYNITNFVDPRFDIEAGDNVDASQTPAYRIGTLLGATDDTDRQVDLIVEDIDGHLSIQLITIVLNPSRELDGIFVVELNNVGVFNSNIQISGGNQNIYSFIVSPDNSNSAIAPPTTDRSLINLDTIATRSSVDLQEAQRYRSGLRQVIGYYTPLFEGFRNDVILVVELDEATILTSSASSLLGAIGPIIIVVVILLAIAIFLINRLFVDPLNRLTNAVRIMNAGDFITPIPAAQSNDEIGRLSETVVELQQQVRDLTTDLSSRIDARSRDLQVTQEIGRVAISETNLTRLMNQVVDLIASRFDQVYHAQIFLIEGNYAVLRASTGEAGKQLLARGHRLGVGSLSVIGQVTQQNQTIIARDTAASEVHRRNEFLRDTRSEIAIPMRLGSRVIGALDIQSTLRDVFDDDLVTILETMTDQVAIAIENSRLYEESQHRLEEFETATRQRIQRDWEDFMYSQRSQQMITHAGAQVVYDFSDLRQKASQTGQITVGKLTDRKTIPVAIPVVIRDQVLGVIEWELSQAEFNQNRILLAEELAARLAISLDNARLVQAGRQTTENERIINTISAKISGQTDIEQILQTAIQEVGQALRAPRVNIQLHQQNSNGHHPDNGDLPPTSDNT